MVRNDLLDIDSPVSKHFFYAFSRYYMYFGQVGIGSPVHFWPMAFILWRLIKGSFTVVELQVQQGELSCPTAHGQLPTPAGREGPCRWILLYGLSRRKKGLPPHFHPQPPTAQAVRDGHSSANEKPVCFQLPVYPNGFFVYNSFLTSCFPL